jgi:hypothetical protein
MKTNQIFQKKLEDVEICDVEKLSSDQIIHLFGSLEAPVFSKMKGEYNTKMIKKGLSGWFGDFYVNVLMGPGRWVGDAFYPFEDTQGWGYNKFEKKIKGQLKIIRALKMNTYLGKSVFDEKNSFHVDYSPYCRGLNHSMKDEIRTINDKLYLGLAYFSWSGGKKNPGAFLVFGEAREWIGIDK